MSTSHKQGRMPFVVIAGAFVLLVATAVYVLYQTGGLPHFGESKYIHAHDKSIGQGVTVTGDKVPRDMRAKKARVTRPPFKRTKALGPVLEIEPSGKLPALATITVPTERLPQNATVLMATSQTDRAEDWTLLLRSATILPDRQHIQFATNHLSWWQPLLLDIQGAVGELKKSFLDGMTSSVFAEAEPPKCDNEQVARADDYYISSDAKSTVYWCFGVEHGTRTLKVVNHRSYPLEIEQSGLKVKSTGTGSLDLSELARIGHTIVMPGDTAVFTVSSLAKGRKATLDTKLSKTALGLKAVETIAEAVITVALHTNVGAAVKQLELTGKALGLKGCLGVLGDPTNVGKLIKSCFDEKLLADNFGWRAALLAPVMLAFSLVDLGKSLIGAWNDRNGGSTYHIEITHLSLTTILSSYAGKWTVHGMSLTINSDGSATQSWNEGPCYDSIDNPSPMCEGFAAIRFTPNADGTLTGRITSVWYKTWEGKTPPADFKPTSSFHTGESFRLSHKEAHLLSVDWPDGPGVFCDRYAENHNDSTYQICGA